MAIKKQIGRHFFDTKWNLTSCVFLTKCEIFVRNLCPTCTKFSRAVGNNNALMVKPQLVCMAEWSFCHKLSFNSCFMLCWLQNRMNISTYGIKSAIVWGWLLCPLNEPHTRLKHILLKTTLISLYIRDSLLSAFIEPIRSVRSLTTMWSMNNERFL